MMLTLHTEPPDYLLCIVIMHIIDSVLSVGGGGGGGGRRDAETQSLIKCRMSQKMAAI